MIETEAYLQQLKADKSPRTQKSLDKLHELLRQHFESGNQDFCIATIGRLSKAKGGIGVVSIRNKSGEHYRKLIEAWAQKAGTNLKKPLAEYSKTRDVPADFQLLEKIDEPALRAILGQIIAERNRLKQENKILKQKTKIIVDIRKRLT